MKKFTSLLLIVLVLASSGLCSCLESHAADQPAASSLSAVSAVDTGHCPACPESGHSDADHDAASCFCSCHLPLIELPMEITPSPIAGRLSFIESFTAMPEVYLPKFIPPQNLA